MSSNFPMVQKKSIFSKFIIKIKSFFGKKQYESKVDKAEFFNIYEDIKNGDIGVEELDTEILEALVKIANEEKIIKAERLNLLKKELNEIKYRVVGE